MKKHYGVRGLLTGLFEVQLGYVRKPVRRLNALLTEKLEKK